jgi:chromosome segregation ATPase
LQVTNLHALAGCLLATPRYGDATLHDRDAAVLRQRLRELKSRIDATDARLREAQDKASAYQTNCQSLEEQRREITSQMERVEARAREAEDQASVYKADLVRLEFRTASLTKQLERAEEQLQGLGPQSMRSPAQGAIAALEHEITAIRASTSWRVTAPLRFIKRAARALATRGVIARLRRAKLEVSARLRQAGAAR